MKINFTSAVVSMALVSVLFTNCSKYYQHDKKTAENSTNYDYSQLSEALQENYSKEGNLTDNMLTYLSDKDGFDYLKLSDSLSRNTIIPFATGLKSDKLVTFDLQLLVDSGKISAKALNFYIDVNEYLVETAGGYEETRDLSDAKVLESTITEVQSVLKNKILSINNDRELSSTEKEWLTATINVQIANISDLTYFIRDNNFTSLKKSSKFWRKTVTVVAISGTWALGGTAVSPGYGTIIGAGIGITGGITAISTGNCLCSCGTCDCNTGECK